VVSYRVPFAKWPLTYFGLAITLFTAVGIWLIARYADHGTPGQLTLVVSLVVFNLFAHSWIFLREPTTIRIEDDGSIVFVSPFKRTRQHIMDLKNIISVEGGHNLLQMNFTTNTWVRYRSFPDHDLFISDLRAVNPNFEYGVA